MFGALHLTDGSPPVSSRCLPSTSSSKDRATPAMGSDLVAGTHQGKVKPPPPEARSSSRLREMVFQTCMKAVIILGSCYVVFVAYIAMTYPRSWVEELQLLPLIIVSIIIPVLAVVMIRK